MKKITLLLLMCFSTFLGSAQVALTEGFEGTSVPAAGSWALGSGSWAVFDNGVGIVNTWAANNVASEGTRCAYMNGAQDNITAGNSAQDWLVTPAVTVPTNGQLRFFTRQSLAAESGTKYQIRVSSTSQTNASSFTVLQEWNETTLNAQFNVYEEKVVPLNLPAGSTVYVAFVMLKDGPGAGDRWHVDAVKVVEECVAPTGLSASGVSQTGANLTWLNPGGATSWEVEIIPGTTTTPSGHGVIYNGNSPYAATGTATGSPLVQAPFAASTEYKYYVRAICSSTSSTSAWVGPFTFTTGQPGFTCSSAISVLTLPYSTTDNTSNYGDTVEGNPGTTCGAANAYLGGNDVFYSYTATETGVISITMSPTATYSGLFVYNGCANVGVSCIAGVADATTGVRSIPALAVTAGQTYVILISTWPAPQTTAYTLTIQKVNCTPPTTLAATNILETSATLSWANPGNLASSWQVDVQTAGTPIPTGAGVTTTNNTAYPAAGLLASTPYRFYVRADCGDGTFSTWAGPFLFNTQCTSFNVPFQEGFNSTSATQFCWTVLNLNGDTDAWNMDYATTPFEGNQVATLTTDFNNGNNDDWLISPTINVTGNQRLKYHYRVQSATEPDAFEVKLSTTGAGAANFTQTIVPLATYNNITYVEKIVNLTGITGPINIGFHVPPGGPDGWRLYIDNVIVEDIPTCPVPSALAASPTTTGAQLSWTAGNVETQWQVVVQAPGTGVPAATAGGTPVGNPFTTTTPLTPATTYEYYVRAYCAANDVSQWVGPFSFTTLCTALNVPFYEGFNSNSTTQTCWTVLNLNGDTDAWNMDYATTPFEGNQVATLTTDFNNGNNDDWLISPTLNLTGNQRLKYHYKVQSTTEPDAFEVKLSTTGAGAASFTQTIVPLATYNNITYVEKIVNLTGVTGPVNIGFHVPQGGPDGWRLYIDNVIVENIPSCPNPSLLAAAPTTTGAQLSWTAGNVETQWQVVVQAPGTGVPAATAGGTPVGNPFTTTTPLTPATAYEYYVRAYCAADDQSQWVGPFSFTTLCNPFPTPFYEGFNSDSPTESCWTVLNLNGDTDAWDMNYATTPFEGNQSAALNTDFNNGNNDDWLISPTIILAANQRIKFHYRVQSAGEPNDFEVLMSTTGIAPASFTQQIVPLQSYNNIVYEQSITNLTGITGPVNFAWHVPNGGLDGWRIYIDNVIIEDIPPCPEPLDIEISCLSSQGGNVTWTQGGTETSWEVAVVPAGSGAPTVADDTVTPDPLYYIQGLNPETAYDFYVRAVCPGMGDGFGAWVSVEFTTPTTSVSDAQPFCASAGQSILFQNTDDSMNVTEYGQVACLGSTPNPVWYYLQVDTAGDLDFQLIQNTSFDDNGNPTGNALDVDFVAFGPFTSLNQACGEIVLEDCPTCPNNTGNTTFYPFGNIVDCSYSAAAIENFTIPNAQPGEIYAVLITNFNGDPGQILLEQLSSSTATTNCNILYNVDLGADQNLCGVTETTVTATVTTPGQSAAPAYQWFMDGNAITPTIVGNTALSQTIQVNTQGSHIYTVVITVENSANTEPITDAVTIVLGPAVTATAPQEYAVCDDASNDGFANFDLTTLNPQVLGTLDASQYTVSYHLTQADADANTAPIAPANTFTNTVADTQTLFVRVQSNLVNACFDVVEAVLVVNDLPVTTLDPSYSICSGDSVTITGVATNYAVADATFQWLLNGTALAGETAISIVATQAGTYTLQVTLGTCVNTTQTTVVVNQLPQFTLPSDFSFCTGNSATITVTPGNFNATQVTYTWTLDGAAISDTTSTITVTQEGVYEVTVNNGGCTTTDSVLVTEVGTPVADAPIDVVACETYVLPTLTAGNGYFTQTGGAGTAVSAGTSINTDTQLFVYVSNGTNCSDENSFFIDIIDRPIVSVTGSCQGSEYIIEASIVNENLSVDDFTFSWTDALGNSVGGNTSTITVTVAGLYSVSVAPINSTVSCTSDEVFEANGTTCMIPKGISPNGDGKNDTFDLSGLQVRKISIFNRYGTIVYDKSNYTNEWFGQSNKGDELPDGTYFYSFEREGGESKTGWIYINRQRN